MPQRTKIRLVKKVLDTCNPSARMIRRRTAPGQVDSRAKFKSIWLQSETGLKCHKKQLRSRWILYYLLMLAPNRTKKTQKTPKQKANSNLTINNISHFYKWLCLYRAAGEEAVSCDAMLWPGQGKPACSPEPCTEERSFELLRIRASLGLSLWTRQLPLLWSRMLWFWWHSRDKGGHVVS